MDVGVNWVIKNLFWIVDMLEKMLVLGEDWVCEEIKIIGFYKNKVKNVIFLFE